MHPTISCHRNRTRAQSLGRHASAISCLVFDLSALSNETDERTVFVVHGRDRAARDALFTFLRSLGLKPLEWQQIIDMTGSAAPYVGDLLHAAFNAAQAVVVLLTPDDLSMLRQDLRSTDDPLYESALTGQARPNVLFEAGMAFGRNPSQTVLVEIGRLRPFSDIGGRHVIRLDGSVVRRQELALRLANAGCAVDMTGSDWHTAGDFTSDVTRATYISRDDGGPDVTKDFSEGPWQHDPSDAHNAVPTVAAIRTGSGRYQVSVANDGQDDIKSLKLWVPADCPFFLFDAHRDPVQLPSGTSISYTLVAIQGDPIGADCPFTVEGEYGSGTEFQATLTLALGPESAGSAAS